MFTPRDLTIETPILAAKCGTRGCTAPASDLVLMGSVGLHACLDHRVSTMDFLMHAERIAVERRNKAVGNHG